MYHSITFGDKNTWDDWHLIPKSRPVVNPPSVKTNYVSIPGGDGSLDLTTVLSGRPLYNNRSGSFDFYVENGFRPWSVLYTLIMEHLHGKTMRMTLEDDPLYYYEGRYSVSAWKSDSHWSSITINYNVDPYKRCIYGTDDEWIWDTFNFNNGIIRYFKDMQVDGSLTVRLIGTMMPIVPVFISSTSTMSLSFNDSDYQLTNGTNSFNDVIIQNGENILTFNGFGIVTIEYNGGTL